MENIDMTKIERILDLKQKLINADPHNGFVIKRILLEILDILEKEL